MSFLLNAMLSYPFYHQSRHSELLSFMQIFYLFANGWEIIWMKQHFWNWLHKSFAIVKLQLSLRIKKIICILR